MTVDPALFSDPDATRTRASRCLLSLKHLYIILWKNVYIKKLARHYSTTLVEVAFILILLLGIEEESVVREPLVRVADTIYKPSRTDTFWNTQRDQARIQEVFFYPADNKYLNRLTQDAFSKLGVSNLVKVPTMRQLMEIEELRSHPSKDKTPQRSVRLLFSGVDENDTASQPVSLHVSLLAGRLPFDLQVDYRQRLIAQPEGPVAEERFPEIHTLLPIIGALQQRHLELQAERFHYEHPVEELRLQRFPFPPYIEHRDLKNYALVLTRFCFGVLIPFTVLVANVTDEKATGKREMLRAMGVSDWVYWASHYLTSFFMHLIIVTLMLLFVCVKRNTEGRAFIQYSDPTLVFVILMFFCSQCLVHGIFLSTFFANQHSAIAGAMLYWTFSCVMPFLMLEHAGGQGYYYIERKDKLMTAIFPGMSLHWSFRVLERFEKFVEHGANWGNFYDRDATPDNVTLAEIVLVGSMFDFTLAALLWYLDNVFSLGPGVHKPFYFPLMIRYWMPSRSFARAPARTAQELPNFENEPADQPVTVDLVHVCKDYDGVVAVDDVSLRIFDKQITVLLGHNGAGKTSLLNMIAGFLDCTSGVVLIGGYDIRICTRDARRSIGYCAQNNELFEDLTVEEHLMFFAIVKGVPLDKARNEVVNLLHETSLIEHRSVMAEQLSLSLQRRLSTAIAILATPKLVIMDEPTTNMDPEGRREIWEILLKLRRTTCILLTTHNLDEADVVGDRIAIMANGRIRCCGSPAFLKQRFGTGYRMRIHKLPRRANVPEIETLLRKYAPKARLDSDSPNEAVFLLGQIIATSVIIDMFKKLEQQTKELGIESVGLTVTSLEDVMIRVGERYHVHRAGKRPEDVKEARDEATVIAARVPVVKTVAQAVGSEASLSARVWAILVKRAIHVWRERRMPLFSWILPPALLSLLFLLEYAGLRGSSQDVLHTGDTLSYSFPEVIGYAHGFQQVDTEDQFLDQYLGPMFATDSQYRLRHLAPTVNIPTVLLDYAREQLYEYVFNFHFGYQMTKAAGNLLWYNGQIQHCALLTVATYNDARLRNVTGVEGAQFTFDVTDTGNVASAAKEEGEIVDSQNTYREILPKVLRSIFFPLVSSLMCSNFVLFPIAERALQVKHLQILTGLTSDLYWMLNFGFDFLFYMGTATFVLPPLALFHWGTLSDTDISLIFSLNLLHGYAALPIIYIISFLFDNPGHGFSKLAILTFVISTLGCLGEVFMEHYADDVNSVIVSAVIGTARQVMRLLPSCSYSRAMTKVLQLSAESSVCRRGGLQLQIQCRTKVTEAKLSLKQCCKHIKSEDPARYLIHPFDVHPYSAFYEVATLSVEGAAVFLLLLILERCLRKADQTLSSTEAVAYDEDTTMAYSKKQALTPQRGIERKKLSTWEDTDVVAEAELVAGLVSGELCSSEDKSKPAMIVHSLRKAYGYLETNVVLKGLSFTVRAGECFGLLGVNGVGKTTTFRILTGEILPHAGDAYIRPFSVVRDTRPFQRYLGYCPQKDGLLDMLTGVETLLFFMRLRSIAMTQQYLDALLDIFRLEDIADQLVSTYSTGNRRKLSLCVSILGMPRVLLLDEPYVGVGAAGRRRVVKYISALQSMAQMSIVLTSHSLSDVEFLCNRIAILGDGTLQCLGSMAQLKEKFGKGYTITVKTYPDRKDDKHYQRELSAAVCSNFPLAELVHTYEGVLEFRMSRVRMPWSQMFARMARIKRLFKLKEFFIADTSLAQIFRSVTHKEASEAAAAAEKQLQQQTAVAGRMMASTLGF